MQFPYILTDNTFTVFVQFNKYQTDRTNPNWEEIKRLVNESDVDGDRIIQLVCPVIAIAVQTADIKEIEVRNGAVYYGDSRIHDDLAKRLIDVMNEQMDITPWKLFTANIFANPAKFAQQELYDFLEKSDLPITEDGCFLAYKMVGGSYKDIHSGKFDNSVGKVCEMPREDVDPDRYQTCSTGLHFCSKDYLGQYGRGNAGHTMIVKINPADVVSIPTDYNHAKGRTWRYEVVGEIANEEAASKAWPAVDHEYQAAKEVIESYYDNDCEYCGSPYCDGDCY